MIYFNCRIQLTPSLYLLAYFAQHGCMFYKYFQGVTNIDSKNTPPITPTATKPPSGQGRKVKSYDPEEMKQFRQQFSLEQVGFQKAYLFFLKSDTK